MGKSAGCSHTENLGLVPSTQMAAHNELSVTPFSGPPAPSLTSLGSACRWCTYMQAKHAYAKIRYFKKGDLN